MKLFSFVKIYKLIYLLVDLFFCEQDMVFGDNFVGILIFEWCGLLEYVVVWRSQRWIIIWFDQTHEIYSVPFTIVGHIKKATTLVWKNNLLLVVVHPHSKGNKTLQDSWLTF